MKALVYHGPGIKAWEEAPTPTLQATTDVIVRVIPPPSADPTSIS
jgi:alcohol dehydrogenase